MLLTQGGGKCWGNLSENNNQQHGYNYKSVDIQISAHDGLPK